MDLDARRAGRAPGKRSLNEPAFARFSRYTGNLGMNRSAMTGGHRQRYYVDERLRREMFEFRQTLPAYQKWRDSLDAVHDNRVTVIMGETGSGKTTQIPQFILDELLGTRNGQIVVTQPRRISAITVAERVAKERGQQVGQEVGYQVCTPPGLDGVIDTVRYGQSREEGPAAHRLIGGGGRTPAPQSMLLARDRTADRRALYGSESFRRRYSEL